MGVDADTKKARNKLTIITRSAMIDTMNEARLELVNPVTRTWWASCSG